MRDGNKESLESIPERMGFSLPMRDGNWPQQPPLALVPGFSLPMRDGNNRSGSGIFRSLPF